MRNWIEPLPILAAWLNLYPNMSLENLPIVGSDHGPITITLSRKVNSGTKPFRFEAMWLSHDSLVNIVKN